MALSLRSLPSPLDDEAIAALAERAPGWHFEIDAEGALVVSPTFSDSGPRDVEAAVQLRAYAAVAGGKVFGSSAGFRLRDNSVRVPDAAWISAERLASFGPEARVGFWRVAPDVVIEILSATDTWADLVAKLTIWVDNGTTYAIAIDPFGGRVASAGSSPPGLVLDVEAIARA